MQSIEAASDKGLMTLFNNSSFNFELKFQTNIRLLPKTQHARNNTD